MTTPSWMPSLNEDLPGEIKTMMREYAEVAVEAYRRSLKPVAWRSGPLPDFGQYSYVTQESAPLSLYPVVPLYRLDDQP